MFNKSMRMLAVLLLPVALVACSDDQVTLHEPGVYKGKTDPLLAKSGPEMDKTLAERFLSVQKDR